MTIDTKWMGGLGALIVGVLLLCAPLAAYADDMTFTRVALTDPRFCGARCVDVVAGHGEITDRTAEEFLAFAVSNMAPSRTRNVLLIDSPGGNVVGSLKFGHVLRQLGTAVIVARIALNEEGQTAGIAAGRCMSACVYALMGGTRRIIPQQSQVGIHRMYRREMEGVGRSAETVTTYAPSTMVDALNQYTGAMGISRQLIAAAEQIPPEEIKVLTPSEIRRWHLGTTRF